MPYFRFIIEGADLEMPSLGGKGEEFVTGFFAGRRVKADNIDEAQAKVCNSLKDEWHDYAPTLTVIDRWKAPTIELRRRPNAGHAFFSDEFGRYAAASLEAKATLAPKSAAIWELANLHVDDDDD